MRKKSRIAIVPLNQNQSNGSLKSELINTVSLNTELINAKNSESQTGRHHQETDVADYRGAPVGDASVMCSIIRNGAEERQDNACLLYTSPSPRDA